ncbi:MAG: hypothetical protein ACUVSX_16610 [Aggregatilineales bacterium]
MISVEAVVGQLAGAVVRLSGALMMALFILRYLAARKQGARIPWAWWAGIAAAAGIALLGGEVAQAVEAVLGG